MPDHEEGHAVGNRFHDSDLLGVVMNECAATGDRRHECCLSLVASGCSASGFVKKLERRGVAVAAVFNRHARS